MTSYRVRHTDGHLTEWCSVRKWALAKHDGVWPCLHDIDLNDYITIAEAPLTWEIMIV